MQVRMSNGHQEADYKGLKWRGESRELIVHVFQEVLRWNLAKSDKTIAASKCIQWKALFIILKEP